MLNNSVGRPKQNQRILTENRQRQTTVAFQKSCPLREKRTPHIQRAKKHKQFSEFITFNESSHSLPATKFRKAEHAGSVTFCLTQVYTNKERPNMTHLPPLERKTRLNQYCGRTALMRNYFRIPSSFPVWPLRSSCFRYRTAPSKNRVFFRKNRHLY